MLLTNAILRLRAQCPIFAKRVAGTSSFSAASGEHAEIDVPAAFVVPLYRQRIGNPTGNINSPEVDQFFGVIVAVDNTPQDKASGRLSAVATLETASRQLEAALLGWTPETIPWGDECRFVRDEHLFMDAARLWHQFQFAVRYQISTNPAADDNAIQAIVDGPWFPNLDPLKVRHIFAGNEPFDMPAEDPHDGNWAEAFHVLTDTLPSWIRHPGDGRDPPHVRSPGPILQGERRTMDVPGTPEEP